MRSWASRALLWRNASPSPREAGLAAEIEEFHARLRKMIEDPEELDYSVILQFGRL
jgi:hypothetical protein